MSSENKNLLKAGIASATIHGFVVAFGCLNIFESRINNDMFLNVELAGASELQQALDDYNNRPIIEESQQLKIDQPKETKPEKTTEEGIQQEEPESKQEKIPEEQLVKGPSIVEPQPELESEIEPEPEPEPEPKFEEQPKESGESLPPELKNEEVLRLEKAEREKQEKLRKEKEEKRLEEKRKKEKKKREAERRRKKRLEAIKRIEKKNKAKKKRLAKIANAIKKNNEAKKKKDDSFTKMMRNEKNNWNRSSRNGSGLGNGNGLGSYGDGMGFVDSDAAIISNQIIPHWVVAGGVKNAETLIIRIRIKVKDNGEVPASSIEILDKDRYNSDAVFKSAADSAKRAILKASPLRIPAEKMHLFRDFEISFNTDKALGVKR